MRKSTLLLSIALTGIVLGLLFALVSVSQTAIETTALENDTQVQEQTQPQQSGQSIPYPADVSPSAAANVEIFDAAAIAARILGHNDVYIAEYAQLDGADVYLVTFLSGDLVYVSLDGQVISASKQEPIKPNHPASHR